MHDSLILLIIAVVLMGASALARDVSFGMSPQRHKPRYAVTRRFRLVLFALGALFLGLALGQVLRK